MKFSLTLFIVFVTYSFPTHLYAQMPTNKDTIPKNKMERMNMKMDSTSQNNKEMQDMSGMEMGGMSAMSHSYSINLPMNRNGSGTGWLPDASPMYGYMIHSKKWMYMFHGSIFIRYNRQDIGNVGSRG